MIVDRYLSVSIRALCRSLAGLALLVAMQPQAFAQEEIWAIEMRQGDTISGIARRYLINPNDWMKLQQFNNVRLDRGMPVGTRVNVPAAWMRIADLDAQIVAVRGTIRIERGGGQVPATVGTAVKTGDRIAAAEASSVTLKFTDGTLSTLHANSEARIAVMRGVPSTDLIAQRLRLDAGRIEHAVTPRKNPSSKFEVETPVATIGVRGTKFRTAVDDTSRGEVLEGRVEALGTGSRTPVAVGAGFASVIPASGIPSQPIALLPQPDLSKNVPLHELAQPIITFAPIANAEQYRAMVASDSDFANVVTEIVSKQPRIQLPAIGDGNYYLRVRGIDANRIEGFNGQFRFDVKIGTPPPPVAIAPEFDATVPGGRNVLISWHPEKLAASYRFQVDTDDRFQRVLHGALRTSTLRFALGGLKPGRYVWRLASNRPDGERGPWGPIMQFVVESPAEPAANAEPAPAK